ncbi:MAG TPA: glucokinase [Nitrospirota bacterium]|nr:glucokinase [Nitrospirota bacterium]
MLVLAGDIGGTSARLAYFRIQGDRTEIVSRHVYKTSEFSTFAELIEEFVTPRNEQAEAACFSIAGAVLHEHVLTPNLGWTVDAEEVSRRFSIKQVHVMNDLEANAYGISTLVESDFAVLNEEALEAAGNRAVLSAGTGLGEAGLYWDGKQHCPFATEGGHADLAPRNALEVDLFLHLLGRFEPVSCERLVSGPGIYNVYQFLRDTGRGEELTQVAEAMKRDSAPAVISRYALSGVCSLCAQTLDVFISLYGAEAGNFALKVMATGGVFIGGGIAPKIIEKLRGPLFMEAFNAKGRLRNLLESMPVRAILNDMTALQGAARYAAVRFS